MSLKATLKSSGRALLRPIVNLLASLHVPPSAVTLAALPLSLLAAVAFGLGWFLVGGIFVALVGLCDSVDGELSRLTGKASPQGAFLDSNVDRISEALVLIGIYWFYAPVSQWFALLAVLAIPLSLLVSYVRARAEGVGRECKVGWFERPVRVLVLLAGAVAGPWLMPVALGVIVFGSALTVVQRLLYVLGRPSTG
jgi:CDP-diacylglycerol--glycerol-3-phosphate 3-phosphatidyltransferase